MKLCKTHTLSSCATTSLPEHVGGVRNWDYRFCWLRDGALAASALAKLGSSAEAMQFLDWVLGVVSSTESPERLQPLYGVTGEGLGPEAEIGELSGYRGSRPVRIGNMAARQVQLDVFGPIVDLLALLVFIEYGNSPALASRNSRHHVPCSRIWSVEPNSMVPRWPRMMSGTPTSLVITLTSTIVCSEG